MPTPVIPILAPGTVVMRDLLPGLIQTRAVGMDQFSATKVFAPFATDKEFFVGATGSTTFAMRRVPSGRVVGAEPNRVLGDVGSTTTIDLIEGSVVSDLDKSQDPLIRNGMPDDAEQQKVLEAVGALATDLEVTAADASFNPSNFTGATRALTNGFINGAVDPVLEIGAEIGVLEDTGVDRSQLSLVMHPRVLRNIGTNTLFLSKYFGATTVKVVPPSQVAAVLVSTLGVRDVRIVRGVSSSSPRDTAALTLTQTWSIDRVLVTIINDDPRDITSPQFGKMIYKNNVVEGQGVGGGAQLGALAAAIQAVIYADNPLIRSYLAVCKYAFYRHPSYLNISRLLTGVSNA